MSSTKDPPTLWDRLSPEQQARIIALLVQMLLRQWNQEIKVQHEPA